MSLFPVLKNIHIKKESTYLSNPLTIYVWVCIRKTNTLRRLCQDWKKGNRTEKKNLKTEAIVIMSTLCTTCYCMWACTCLSVRVGGVNLCSWFPLSLCVCCRCVSLIPLVGRDSVPDLCGGGMATALALSHGLLCPVHANCRNFGQDAKKQQVKKKKERKENAQMLWCCPVLCGGIPATEPVFRM